jgi:cytochrome c oxidase cbb3-type subunit I/II
VLEDGPNVGPNVGIASNGSNTTELAAETTPALDKFAYNDAIVRAFLGITVLWGVVAFLVGIALSLQLVMPSLNLGLPYTAFGRLRPLHTTAAIFAFAGNAIFAAVYYSTQRLCKARILSGFLSWLHFWGWQGMIVAAAATLPLGYNTGREYAEPAWPIKIAIGLLWIFFAVNFFGTLYRRRQRRMYVALWFYIATVVTFPLLYLINGLSFPVTAMKSYPVYAGVQDAFMQSCYGHNAIMGFMLTMPLLGMMYYFLPKAADRPVYSYRLCILHFWSLVAIYIWAGPQLMQYTPLPEWAARLGMLFSIMLWMPSWAGMLNGLLTLRGAWSKIAADPVLKFFVVALTFYGMATLEGPLLSIHEVSAVAQYTDMIVAHVHTGMMGWVAFMIYGTMYWLMPRVFRTPLWSKRLMNWHFWLATFGILLFIVPSYVAGLAQGLMWQSVDGSGNLQYPSFIDALRVLMPMYWLRVGGGSLYFAGLLLCGLNLIKTMACRPAMHEEEVHEAAPLSRSFVEPPQPVSRLTGLAVAELGHKIDIFEQGWWHRRLERRPLRFAILVFSGVLIALIFEVIETFAISSNVPPVSPVATVKPYTPLELLGRDTYIANGCCNCHTQMIRPLVAETKRYVADYSKASDSVFDRPAQWGSRRIGPDLAREGGKQAVSWHALHLQDPRSKTPGSIMPSYAWMLDAEADFAAIPRRMAAMRTLGVPYTEAEIDAGIESARKQAKDIAVRIVGDNGPKGLETKEVVALIAYIDRLGRELVAVPPPSGTPLPATKLPEITK